MPARGVAPESDLGVTAPADEEALLHDNSLTRPSTNSCFACGRKQKGGRGHRKEREGRDPQGHLPPRTQAVRPSHTGGTCFRMLFMTPMKPANNLASSRAASFFSVFFLLFFSTPEAAILRQLGSRPGLAGSGERVHAEASVYQPPRPRLRLQRPAPEPGGSVPCRTRAGGGACALRLGGRGRGR